MRQYFLFKKENRGKLQKKYKIIHKNLCISCRIIFHVFINQTTCI